MVFGCTYDVQNSLPGVNTTFKPVIHTTPVPKDGPYILKICIKEIIVVFLAISVFKLQNLSKSKNRREI